MPVQNTPADKVEDNRPTSQRDLEARLELDHKSVTVDPSDPSKVYAPYATESTDTNGYIGVSNEYMTHASDTEKPYGFKEGAEADSVKEMLVDKFTVNTPEVHEGEQTLGGGSSQESVYTSTSGEDIQSKVVDREEEQKKLAKDDESKPARVTPPARATTRPVSQ